MNYEAYWSAVFGEGSPRRVVHDNALRSSEIEAFVDKIEARAWRRHGPRGSTPPPAWSGFRAIATGELRAALDSLRPGAHSAMLAKIAPRRMVRVFVDLDEQDFAALVDIARSSGHAPAETCTRLLRAMLHQTYVDEPASGPRPRVEMLPPARAAR